MNVEVSHEHSSSFIEMAQEAAINKVVDIHTEPLLFKHGFIRLGDIHNNNGLTNLPVDRLRGILLHGLVAESFARKKGILFSRNWVDPVNKTSISLSNTDVTLEKSFETAILSATHDLKYNFNRIVIPRENLCVILVENKPYAKRNPVEELAKNRVGPQLFKGIVVLDQILSSIRFSECVDLKSTTVQETVDIVVSEMTSINRDRPNFCIPVYGLSGSLYWPWQKSYQEVQNFVKERRSNGVQTSHRS